VLAEGGRAVIIVPGSPRHWGVEDVIAGHLRRYTATTLARPRSHVDGGSPTSPAWPTRWRTFCSERRTRSSGASSRVKRRSRSSSAPSSRATGASPRRPASPAGHDSCSTRPRCGPSIGCRSGSGRLVEGHWSCTASACQQPDRRPRWRGGASKTSRYHERDRVGDPRTRARAA
jgi:hypothetical protein